MALSFSIVDAQNTWQFIPGPYGGSVVAMAVSDDEELFIASSSGIYKSVDQGNSWNRTIENSALDLFVDGFGKIYVVTNSGYLITSTNGGLTFEIGWTITG